MGCKFGRFEVEDLNIRDDDDGINDDLENARRLFGVVMKIGAAFLVLVGLWCTSKAYGAVTAEWRVNLVKSSTTIATAKGSTEGEAWSKCLAQIPTSATTSTTYKCQTPVYVAVVSADMVTCAPPQPANETQTVQCQAGTTGSWTQTRTYSCVGTTWTASAWSPTTAPSGACVTPAPTIALVYSATAGGTYAALEGATVAGSMNVRLNGTCPNPAGPWSFTVDGVAMNTENLCPYELGGDNYLLDTKQLPNGAHTIRVVGSQTITATFTVNNVTAPPPTGSATLRWTPPTLNTDGSALSDLAGFRIVYGTSATALTQTVDVPNPGATSYVVDGLASGTWYFTARAYNAAGAESANANVASKVVP
jgi:hypothetical protein